MGTGSISPGGVFGVWHVHGTINMHTLSACGTCSVPPVGLWAPRRNTRGRVWQQAMTPTATKATTRRGWPCTTWAAPAAWTPSTWPLLRTPAAAHAHAKARYCLAARHSPDRPNLRQRLPTRNQSVWVCVPRAQLRAASCPRVRRVDRGHASAGRDGVREDGCGDRGDPLHPGGGSSRRRKKVVETVNAHDIAARSHALCVRAYLALRATQGCMSE